MGRPLRRHAPDTCYLLTTRCHQARFLLRPDPEINQAVLEWLTRAQMAHPDVHILGLCVMSNHLHVLLRDTSAELSDWACYFLGNLARSVNAIRNQRRGVVFERRYSAEPVLDDAALLDRLIYVVTNPVKAELCDQHSRWPGLVLFARSGACESHEVAWVGRKAYRTACNRAQKRGQAPPDPHDFLVRENLVLHPLVAESREDSEDRQGVVSAIGVREQELVAARKRSGRPRMSRAKVLSQDWQAAPRHPKRSPRPVCHTADPGLYRAFVEGLRQFVEDFREASAQWRTGNHTVSFPQWSYPPGCPLVRSIEPAPG